MLSRRQTQAAERRAVLAQPSAQRAGTGRAPGGKTCSCPRRGQLKRRGDEIVAETRREMVSEARATCSTTDPHDAAVPGHHKAHKGRGRRRSPNEVANLCVAFLHGTKATRLARAFLPLSSLLLPFLTMAQTRSMRRARRGPGAPCTPRSIGLHAKEASFERRQQSFGFCSSSFGQRFFWPRIYYYFLLLLSYNFPAISLHFHIIPLLLQLPGVSGLRLNFTRCEGAATLRRRLRCAVSSPTDFANGAVAHRLRTHGDQW